MSYLLKKHQDGFYMILSHLSQLSFHASSRTSPFQDTTDLKKTSDNSLPNV